MKEWFSQLNQREQLSLLLLSLALLVYLLYILVLSPLESEREQLIAQNSAVIESQGRVDAMVSQLLQLREGGAKAGAKRNLTSVINQSTSRLQLPVMRLQPNSRGEIQVRIENASFNDVLKWLNEMEYTESLLVREVSVTPAASAGRINITVRIAEAG
ncbi:MAG: type II secretion system protein GspM [Halioglobus sp.]|uniref:type II secretion system protein GspM n=1 Tax=Halioglobus sp. Uisw_031 TaxID=3230977 RepID=UPI003591EA43